MHIFKNPERLSPVTYRGERAYVVGRSFGTVTYDIQVGGCIIENVPKSEIELDRVAYVASGTGWAMPV